MAKVFYSDRQWCYHGLAGGAVLLARLTSSPGRGSTISEHLVQQPVIHCNVLFILGISVVLNIVILVFIVLIITTSII